MVLSHQVLPLGASGCTARSRNRRQAVAGHDSTASWKNWMMGKLEPLYLMVKAKVKTMVDPVNPLKGFFP